MVVPDEVEQSVYHEDDHFDFDAMSCQPGLPAGNGYTNRNITNGALQPGCYRVWFKKRERKDVRRTVNTPKSSIQGLDPTTAAQKKVEFSS